MTTSGQMFRLSTICIQTLLSMAFYVSESDDFALMNIGVFKAFLTMPLIFSVIQTKTVDNFVTVPLFKVQNV